MSKSIKKIDGQEFIKRSNIRQKKLKQLKKELEEDEKKLKSGGIQQPLTKTISRNTIPTNKRNKRIRKKINDGVQEEFKPKKKKKKKQLSEWNIFVKKNFKNVQGDTFGEKMKNLKELFDLVN